MEEDFKVKDLICGSMLSRVFEGVVLNKPLTLTLQH